MFRLGHSLGPFSRGLQLAPTPKKCLQCSGIFRLEDLDALKYPRYAVVIVVVVLLHALHALSVVSVQSSLDRRMGL